MWIFRSAIYPFRSFPLDIRFFPLWALIRHVPLFALDALVVMQVIFEEIFESAQGFNHIHSIRLPNKIYKRTSTVPSLTQTSVDSLNSTRSHISTGKPPFSQTMASKNPILIRPAEIRKRVNSQSGEYDISRANQEVSVLIGQFQTELNQFDLETKVIFDEMNRKHIKESKDLEIKLSTIKRKRDLVISDTIAKLQAQSKVLQSQGKAKESNEMLKQIAKEKREFEEQINKEFSQIQDKLLREQNIEKQKLEKQRTDERKKMIEKQKDQISMIDCTTDRNLTKKKRKEEKEATEQTLEETLKNIDGIIEVDTLDEEEEEEEIFSEDEAREDKNRLRSGTHSSQLYNIDNKDDISVSSSTEIMFFSRSSSTSLLELDTSATPPRDIKSDPEREGTKTVRKVDQEVQTFAELNHSSSQSSLFQESLNQCDSSEAESDTPVTLNDPVELVEIQIQTEDVDESDSSEDESSDESERNQTKFDGYKALDSLIKKQKKHSPKFKRARIRIKKKRPMSKSMNQSTTYNRSVLRFQQETDLVDNQLAHYTSNLNRSIDVEAATPDFIYAPSSPPRKQDQPEETPTKCLVTDLNSISFEPIIQPRQSFNSQNHKKSIRKSASILPNPQFSNMNDPRQMKEPRQVRWI